MTIEHETAEDLEVVAWGMPDKATKITDEAVEALLPCPFCRGPAVDGYHESFSTDSSFPFIGCERCGVEVGYSNSGWLDAEDRARAVSTWNTRALEAALPHLSGVSVKLLEWQPKRWIDDNDWAQDADTSIGWYISTSAGWFLMGQTPWNEAESFDAAKAAAQADYERRIMSALEVAK